MKIIVVGAGKVGTTLIENFVKEGHDVVVVDLDENMYYIGTIEQPIQEFEEYEGNVTVPPIVLSFLSINKSSTYFSGTKYFNNLSIINKSFLLFKLFIFLSIEQA